MKKITDFIVDKRYLFLILFVILGITCLFLSSKVNINEDIMEYLPKDSETKIGKDIMDKEFTIEDSSVLNVMFKDLSKRERYKILDSLEKIDGVSSVVYDESETYNKDGYSLYLLNVDDYADSKKAKYVYDYVNENYDVSGLSGSIYEENKPVLPLWIVVLAVSFAMVILVILSDSYLEPFLYLTSIGIAILLNKGTNIMFSSVSSITNSITAILQLALSMDYSIMLSNRYKQEKEKGSSKILAMKEALYQSFKAISSSSVTTIVGLLALVFMSFTIGRDLGFVLAKGVLLSLVCIFFCLPALLLLFDNLILKTKKRTPKFNLSKLGNFIYKTRYVQFVFIVFMFGLAYFLKGNVRILFTDSEKDNVGKVFPEVNQMAIVYDNKYEDFMSSYCKTLESDKKIDQVLCYSNTINEPLYFDELNDKFKDLGQDVAIDDYLIKIIYYNYFNKDVREEIGMDDFVSFVKSHVIDNSSFSGLVSDGVRDNVDLLSNFTSPSLINKSRGLSDVSSVLGISEKDARDILVYYNSKKMDFKMTIQEFLDFMVTDVLNSEEYSSVIGEESKKSLEFLKGFTDKEVINAQKQSSELSQMLGVSEDVINQIFLLYRISSPSTVSLSLNEFSMYALSMMNMEAFSDYMSRFQDVLPFFNRVTLLNSYDGKVLSKEEASSLFSIDSDLLDLIEFGDGLEPLDLIDLLLSNEEVLSKVSSDTLVSLETDKFILSNVSTRYSVSELARVLSSEEVDSSLINAVYGFYQYNREETSMSVLEFVDFVLSNKDNDLLSGSINESVLSQISLLSTVMHSSLDNKYYSAYEVSQLLGTNYEDVKLLFSLYNSKYVGGNEEISLYDFVSFVLSDVLNNSKYSSSFDEESKLKLNTVYEVMSGSLNGVLYTSEDVFQKFSILSKDIDRNLVDLVFMYYGSENMYDSSYKMTVLEFVNYLNSDVISDSRFKDFIDGDLRGTIINSKSEVDKAKKLIVSDKYSRVVLNTRYALEDEETYDFIDSIHDKVKGKDGIYVVGNSAMAVLMSKTFNGELNKITVLTMIFIFVVVAVTFKDLIIPFVLVLIIQTAVYITMSAISVTGGSVYFISLLIVQAILMGATIDYAIVYTSYYRESRISMGVKDSVINAYNKSIHTIVSSASILIIVTLVVAHFADAIAAKICETISEGTFAAVILILFMLPGVLASTDKLICRKGYYKEKKN